MSSSTKCYMCGFNGFKQIDQCIIKFQCSEEHIMDHNFFSKPQEIKTQMKLCTWSNIWGITDGNLTCYGYDSSQLSSILQGYKRDKSLPMTLIAVGKDVLIQNDARTLVIANDGKICELILNEDHTAVVDGTKDHVYGTKGGHIFEGQIERNPEDPCSVRLNLHVITCNFKVKMVSCGFEHTLVLTDKSTVFSFGSDSRGQLGHGEVTVDLIKTPRCVETLSGIPVVTIAAGGWHSTSVTESGDVYVWGWNESGQLGLPKGTISCDDLITSDPSAGEENSRSRKSDLDLEKCSELQSYGDESKDSDEETNEKVQNMNSCSINSEDLSETVLKVVTGEEGKYLKTEQERLQVDFSSRTRRHFPDCVSSLEMTCVSQKYYQSIDCGQVQTVPYGLDFPDELHVKAVSCGTRHTCILSDTGILLTCGWNGYGQLCHGDTKSRDFFEAVPHFSCKNETIVDVKAQYWNTYIVTEKKNVVG